MPTLESPIRGSAHPNTNKWLFEKWCQEVDVEEVLTATLPKQSADEFDEELDLFAIGKKKEVQSSDSEPDLFASPEKGKKAPPMAPPATGGVVQQWKKKKKGEKAPRAAGTASKRDTWRTIPSETNPLGVGDWLTDKDIFCWLDQELCHMESEEPRAWTHALTYINRLSQWMLIVEHGTTMDDMAWCRHPIFVVNSYDKEGLHWSNCAFDCRVRLNRFIIWVWEPLNSVHLIKHFLAVLEKHAFTCKGRALGFQQHGVKLA